MKEWILSVGSIVILTSVISLILPDGKTGKIIKCVFSLIILTVILKPILSIKDGVEIEEIVFNEAEICLQDDFIYYSIDEKMTNYEGNILFHLKNLGIENGSVFIEYYVLENYTAKIEKVVINLNNQVIISNKENIDIIDDIVSYVIKLTRVEKSRVIINE